jgi:hypothetical protein
LTPMAPHTSFSLAPRIPALNVGNWEVIPMVAVAAAVFLIKSLRLLGMNTKF